MRHKAALRTGLVVAAVAYYPVKFYVLDTYHPRFLMRLAFSVAFWVAVLSIAIYAERLEQAP